MADALDWKSAKILPHFYDRIGQALIGAGPCPKIVKFKMGHGYVDESVEPPALLEIPDDLADIPNVFFEGVPELVHSDGRVLSKCHLPQGSVLEPRKYSMTGLYDDQDQLVAVCIDLPDWIVPSDWQTTYAYIDFPNVGENPPEALEETY